VAHSSAGRAAIRAARFAEAEKSYLAALTATAGLPAYDTRVRTTVDNLMSIAATHEHEGRAEDADRLGAFVTKHVEARGIAGSEAFSLDSGTHRAFIPPRARALRFFRRPPTSHAPIEAAFDELILSTARSFGVDPALVKAVMAAESNFEKSAVSRVGAQGLMQLMPTTAREMGVVSPFVPSDNIRGGVRYLSEMLDRYGDVKFALAAYNAGPRAVDRHGGIPPYPETRAYVKRVLGFYREYQVEFTN
jgi:hypothetical protein